ncbi:MAG: hypothetical protein ACR2J0_02355 [Mycobacteriales bacterium]
MYTTEIMRERARELRQAGRPCRDARTGTLRRVRAFAARRHFGR